MVRMNYEAICGGQVASVSLAVYTRIAVHELFHYAGLMKTDGRPDTRHHTSALGDDDARTHRSR